jgi:methionine sulfoxide reductase heme-binding subunit
VRVVVRYTARTSLLFFCLAFSASALHRLWSTPYTRWQLRNRRYLGLSFAVSHLIHLIAIVGFAVMAPPLFAEATSPASFIFGGIGYALIIAMAATSFDRTARAIGPRAWRILHTSGVYYLWFQFMVSFGKRVPEMPNYAWFLVPLFAAMALRVMAAVQAREWRIANSE